MGFKTIEEARNDASMTTNADVVFMRNIVQGDYAWCWPKEYAYKRIHGSNEVVEVK